MEECRSILGMKVGCTYGVPFGCIYILYLVLLLVSVYLLFDDALCSSLCFCLVVCVFLQFQF